LAHLQSERKVYWFKSLVRDSIQFDALPMRPTPDLSVAVVICTRNRPALLRKCLEAITHLEPMPDEVIVVDNTSGDKETEAAARKFSARYTFEPIAGLSRARNRGLAESRSEIVAYIDDDALPTERWLEFLIEPFADSHVGVVTGRTILPDSQADDIKEEPARFLSNKDPLWLEIAAFGGLGIGTNMALRRAACTGGKIFDERLGRGTLFQGMEEHHAFVHLISIGYDAVHVPAAIVLHRSQTHDDIKEDVCNQIAYSMLLFSEHPDQRLNLLRFLFRRARRKPLNWSRDAPDPGEMISSGWRVLLPATFKAAIRFLRNRKPKGK
jgi:glycosyltransferase involved in cell wall biosynthesis